MPLESFNDVYGLEMLLEDYEPETSVQPHYRKQSVNGPFV